MSHLLSLPVHISPGPALENTKTNGGKTTNPNEITRENKMLMDNKRCKKGIGIEVSKVFLIKDSAGMDIPFLLGSLP